MATLSNYPRILVLILLILGSQSIFSQSTPTETAVALLAGRFEGNVTHSDLQGVEKIDLLPSGGRITHYSISLNHGGKVTQLHGSDENLTESAIKILHGNTLKQLYIFDIVAEINGESHQLNCISLKVGNSSTMPVSIPVCVSYVPNHLSELAIPSDSLHLVRKLRGYYNEEVIPFNSLKATVYRGKGKYQTFNYQGQSGLKELMLLLKSLPMHETVFLHEIYFMKDGHKIHGTPLVLGKID